MTIVAARLEAVIGANTSGLTTGLKSAETSLLKFGKSATVIGLGMTAAITAPAILAAKGMLNVAMAAEQSQIAFTTMLGSGEKAKVFLDELQTFAAQTPFEFTELQGAARKLLAMGFAAEDVLPMMTDIGDAVSGLALGSDGVNRVTIALGQMQAKGKVSAQEMMQMTETGIPAWKYLAEAMGVTTGEVQDLSERGLIPAGDAIQYILEGMRGDFGGMMAAQSKTAAGQISNLVDDITKLATSTGEMLLPTLKDLVTAAKGMVESFVGLPVETQKTILGMAGVAAAAGPVTLVMGKIAKGIAGMISIIPGAVGGFKALGAAFSLMKGASTVGGALSVAGLGMAGIAAVALPAAAALAGVAWAWNRYVAAANRAGSIKVSTTWTKFFNDQVTSGKSATDVLKEFQDAQARIAEQTQVNWKKMTIREFLTTDRGEFAKLLIDQDTYKVNVEELGMALENSATSYDDYTSAVIASGEPIRMLSLAEWEAKESMEALQNALANTDMTGLETAARFTEEQMNNLSTAAQGNIDKLGGLVGAYDDLKTKMDTWTSQTAGDVVQMLGTKLPEGSALLKDAYGVVDEVMGTQYTAQLELKESVQALVDQYARTGDLEGFTAGLTKVKEDGLMGMKDELAEVTTKAGELYAKLLALPEEIKINIGFNVQDFPDWLSTVTPVKKKADTYLDSEPRALGGSALAGNLYQVNERDNVIEYFVPASNGRITPLKSGADAQGGGNVTVHANVASQIDIYQLANIIRTEMLRGTI